MAKEPLGTGTLIAFEVSLSVNSGSALATAFPAPVSVITILSPAARPLLILWKLSTNFDHSYKHELFLNDHFEFQNVR